MSRIYRKLDKANRGYINSGDLKEFLMGQEPGKNLENGLVEDLIQEASGGKYICIGDLERVSLADSFYQIRVVSDLPKHQERFVQRTSSRRLLGTY